MNQPDTLSAREVADTFGWKSKRTPCRLAAMGQFPPPLPLHTRPKWSRKVIDQVLAGHWQPREVRYFGKARRRA